MTSQNPEIKYRPSLTVSEIETILEGLEYHPSNPASEISVLKSKLNVFVKKATHGITKPAHVAVGKESIESSFGFSSDTRIKTLYEFWRNPAHTLPFSPAQLELIWEYAFQNDLLSPEESEMYSNYLISPHSHPLT